MNFCTYVGFCPDKLFTFVAMAGFMALLWGVPAGPTPAENLKKWSGEMKAQQRAMERSIRSVEAREIELKNTMRREAKKANGAANVKPMARELLALRRTKTKYYNMNAHLSGMINELRTQSAQASMMSALSSSSAAMEHMNAMMSVPEMRETMKRMSMEMDKAGYIQGLMDETMDAMDPDDIEEDADLEVQKVMEEILAPPPRRAPVHRQAAPVRRPVVADSGSAAYPPSQSTASAAAAPFPESGV